MSQFLTVFSDASFDHVSLAAGYACWARDREIFRASGPIPFAVPNIQFAELFALCRGILLALDHLPHSPETIIVAQSDSTDAIRVLSEHPSTAPEMCRQVVRRANDSGLMIRFKHVKAHTGLDDPRSSVNRWCDLFAKRGMRRARNIIADRATGGAE